MAAPSPTKKVLADLKASILAPAQTSHFLCEFLPPSNPPSKAFADFMKARGTEYLSGNNQNLFQLSCCDATLPGSTLATHEINNDYTGVTERHAYRRQYDDRADFSFYVDKEYKVINYFENWMSFIAGEEDIENQKTPTYNYRAKFPSDYKTDNLYIVKFEKDYSGTSLQYQFINAFPISINSMPVSYSGSELLKCTVSFTYSRYVVQSKSISEATSGAQIATREEFEANRRLFPDYRTYEEYLLGQTPAR